MAARLAPDVLDLIFQYTLDGPPPAKRAGGTSATAGGPVTFREASPLDGEGGVNGIDEDDDFYSSEDDGWPGPAHRAAHLPSDGETKNQKTHVLPGDVFETSPFTSPASSAGVDPKEGRRIRAGYRTLARAARVNKHWLVAARRKLYHTVYFFTWDRAVLLSETLQYWNPSLRQLIRNCYGFARTRPGSGQSSLSTVALDRIFATLPNLRHLDATHLSLDLHSVNLPRLESMIFTQSTFRKRRKVVPKKEPVCQTAYAKDCLCQRCVVQSGLKGFNRREVPCELPEITAHFQSLQQIRVSGTILRAAGTYPAQHKSSTGPPLVHALAIPSTSASPSTSRMLNEAMKIDEPAIASTSALAFQTVSQLHLIRPCFDLDGLTRLFTPLSGLLSHLRIDYPRFAPNQSAAYEDIGLTNILAIVGPRLVSFHASLSTSIGSTVFRHLTSVRDLRIKFSDGTLQTDIIPSLSPSIEVLELRWSRSDEFTQLLIACLKNPEFLPNLKQLPLLKNGAIVQPGLDTTRMVGEVVSSFRDSRGIIVHEPTYAGSLLQARSVADPHPYSHSYDPGYHMYGSE